MAAIPIFLSIIIPGVAISYPLLRKAKLSFFEIVCFGFALGLVIPPTISFIANILGIPFSFELSVGSMLLTTLAGFAWCAYDSRQDPEAYAFTPPELFFSPRRDAVPLILLSIIVLSFFIRIQSVGSIFYEFDPYYYIYIARQLLVLGYVPTVDWTAWYPNPTGHGNILLTGYLEAGWYEIYTFGQGGYDNILLSTIANVYPPVVAAMICFFVFMLLKEEYGSVTGLLAAGFIAVTPRLIEKTVAGEAEIMPWGLFSSFFFFAAYGMAIRRNDRRLAVLAGIAYLSTILGSAYVMVVTLVFVGYLLFETFKRYIKMESLKSLFEINLVVVAFGVFSHILQRLGYSLHWDIIALITSEGLIQSLTWVLIILGAVMGIGLLYYVEMNSKRKETRYNMALIICIIGAFIILLTPLSGMFSSYLVNAISFSKPTTALMQTVAEEHRLTPEEFVALARQSFGILGDFAAPGTTISIGGSTIHVPFLFMLSLLWLVYAFIFRKSNLAILFIMIIFPIAYVGIQKSKYTLQFGFVLVIAVAALMGEIYTLFSSSLKKADKRHAQIVYASIAAIVLFGGSIQPLSDVLPTALTFEPADCDEIYKELVDGGDRRLSYYIYCSRIPAYWLDSMDWVRNNVGENNRVISWWDYGHWINFFGDRPCITRNEHSFSDMDLEVANAFVSAGPEGLKQYMIEHNATHALFDLDLVGKWGALKYLSCVYNNQTDMSKGPTASDCDRVYDFESVFIPTEPTVEESCIIKGNGGAMPIAVSSFGMVYCITEVESNGMRFPVLYNTDQTNPPNNFDPSNATVNRGVLVMPQGVNMDGRVYARYMVLYPDVWYDGVSGFPDRKGKAYDSNFYKGFFLGELEGFELVYPENNTGLNLVQSNTPVRIFKIKE
ncbi:MAG: STT3 domain-containing protein [Candidatus Micrarchaeota archaeon]